ncbi:InlB B-repeat-containing protein [Thermophilibacter provencensis]|uniref:InlB B-repeat-containing protein n=1 Tax=Thermophilibacter provencensis TaxID=1852386 RepID=A0ABT7V4N1_9ACTN|nr:InlB B-repeat-containing protein [Thermophilibacter provencensis]MDM8271559.1 InlB B-repeat-containing protein [Thermophilibacter provencensis]
MRQRPGRLAAVALLAVAFAVLLVPMSARAATLPMYRLYNPYTGEHLYTSNSEECSNLWWIGWSFEGTGWEAPSEGKPVYRLFNPYTDDHHYTMDASERDALKKIGWRYEGVGWYSGGGVPLYRQFNPYVTTGTHNYTTSKEENDALVRLGWRGEGVAWYAEGLGDPNATLVHSYKTVSFNSEGGSEVPSQSILMGERVTRPAGPTRAGYTFKGWYSDFEKKVPYDFSAPVTEAMNLYALWEKNVAYRYEAYYIDGLGSTWYDGSSRTLYIKTDNPTGSFRLADAQATETWVMVLQPGEFLDVKDSGLAQNANFLKVPGGYVVQYRFDTEATGAHTIEIRETDPNDPYYQGAVAATFTADFKSYDATVDAWIDEQIARYTTADMTPPEKMRKICAGLLQEFSYLHVDGENLVFLASEPNNPFFVTKRWDSATSPAVLCQIAECVGGFSSIHNCYGDYPRGSLEWQYTHYLCKCVYQGVEYSFQACPTADTGQVDLASVRPIDFGNLSSPVFDRA